MKGKIKTSSGEIAKFFYPLLIAIIITLILFYIDEGFYNFRWMLNSGNWIAFLIYFSVIYGAQLLLTLPLFRFAPKFILMVTRSVLIILGILFLMLLVFK